MLLDTGSISDYAAFLKIKDLPQFRFEGNVAVFPDEYADRVQARRGRKAKESHGYSAAAHLFDYQRDIAALAIARKCFAVFADCGLGKTLIMLEFTRHVVERGRVLIVSPLMVVDQTIAEAVRFYGDTLPIQKIAANQLHKWLANGTGIGITNYDAFSGDVEHEGKLAGLILDESSMLKSHYGKWGQRIISLGRGVEYKLCLTGTPAPNDRIEYANHAVFLDAFPTVNSFLARFFVNRGQTDNRWELKPHAMRPFYRALSHWCIFLTNPATYGWKDNTATLPPINVHVHSVPMTAEQWGVVHAGGDLFVSQPGGIGSRSKYARAGKGFVGDTEIATNKNRYMQELVAQWPDESTIVWCLYNNEQERMCELFPGAGNISGDTPHAERMRIVNAFKAGELRTMISKGKILGFGLNLQMCSRMVFSGLQDSYETYYQCVKRANRYGSKLPLNVHIPVTDLERPMIETVLAKASRIQRDTEEQEQIFKECANAFGR